MSFVSEFWADVKGKKIELQSALAQPENASQPKDGSIFLMSLFSRQQNTIAGRMSIANQSLAAQRLVEGSHRIATSDEIHQYIEDQKKASANLRSLEISRRNTLQFQVTPQ